MKTLNFFLQANLYLAVFYLFYWLVLRQETFYKINRFYLLSVVSASLLIPFFQLSFIKSWQITHEVNEVIYSYQLSPTLILANKNTEPDFIQRFMYAYLLISFILLIRLIINSIESVRLFKHVAYQKGNAFSFFNKIWVDDSLTQYEAIKKHEEVHSLQGHSFDIMFFEILSALFWINPVVYFYRSSIRNIHEYIADEESANILHSKQEYALLLVSQKFQTDSKVLLTNQFFNQSTLKLRIKMLMKKRSSKIALLKYGFSAPLFVGMMIFNSSSIAKSTEAETIVGKFQAPKQQQKKLLLKSELPKMAVSDSLKPKSKAESKEIFDTVEKFPEFVGGLPKLYEYLGKNIKYPIEAQKNKTQGNVFVKFIIRKDGSIDGLQLLKGIGSGCDEEAIRVIAQMPKWNAGEQNGHKVDVYMTLPISFQLSQDENIEKAEAKVTDTQNISKLYDELKFSRVFLNMKEVNPIVIQTIPPDKIDRVEVTKDNSNLSKSIIWIYTKQ